MLIINSICCHYTEFSKKLFSSTERKLIEHSFINRRGEMEKSTAARGLPVVKAAYSFLRDEISSSFHFPGWNKGRVVCHRPQLKRLLTSISGRPSDEPVNGFVPITNSSFPLPGTRIYTADIDGDEQSITESDTESEAELMATAV